MSKIYSPKGTLLVVGAYRLDKKHGIWKYYDNGKLAEEINFTVKDKYKP